MEVDNCRICNKKLIKIIDLGKMALVNDFKIKGANKKYKISLCFCSKCKHVQIPNLLNPKILFQKYIWETGVSITNNKIVLDLIRKLKKLNLNKNSKILDIASNDGVLLKLFKEKAGCITLGVDPAKNLAKKANENGHKTIAKFFDFGLSQKIKKKFGCFDFITARNVIAHVLKPNQVFKGASHLLNTNGIFIVEVPHLLNIIKDNQYDNIYHEHIGFHSLKSLIDLAKRNNLKAFKVEIIDSQGGSLRCFFKKNSNVNLKIHNSIKKILNFEKKNKLFNVKYLKNYKYKILNHKKDFLNFLLKLKQKGKNISVYGASGRGQSLLQICKISNKIINFAYDKSKLKQNRKTPGTYITVKDPNKIEQRNIDYLIILSWNLKNEIINQEKQFRNDGGKFIVPFPKPKILA